MDIRTDDLQRGTELFINHLEEVRLDNPELPDFHAAFVHYCMNKYALGSSATTHRTDGKHDLGIDFFSSRDAVYHLAQCKIPDRNWIEAHPTNPRMFGSDVLSDLRDALNYLLGSSKPTANDRIKHLYTLVQSDKMKDDFLLALYLIVYGRLNERATHAFNDLKSEYAARNVHIVLQQIDDLVDEFIIGGSRETNEISLDWRMDNSRVLRGNDYCYFLANAADLFHAFQHFGWRLFDLNVRYEVRNSGVNGDIIKSLGHLKSRKLFHQYNNGLTVVATKYTIREQEGRIKLTGAQIVNGLQTVKSIYNAVGMKEVTLEELEADCRVQVKIIRTDDPEFVSAVVRATNNQNPMAQRNLRANSREQKSLRTLLASLNPRWFLQVKEGEWESLTQEQGRFFKQVIGYPPADFRPSPTKKKGRVVDNQEAAKAWLAFIGFADLAGEGVAHYFSNNEVYEIAFTMRPKREHWDQLRENVDFDMGRRDTLEPRQGDAYQYLLAFLLWEFVKNYIPPTQRARESALEEGVKASKLVKAGGSINSPQSVQDGYLATNHTYQTWRLLSNMKELIVETVAQVLLRRYGPLEQGTCQGLLLSYDLFDAVTSGDVREVAQNAATANDLVEKDVFSRIFSFLRYAAGQFWEEKRVQLLSSSRLRSVLLRREVAADYKRQVWELNDRRGLDKPWKPEGKTFLESLPDLK